jgi:hypothetical protein
MRYMEHKLLHVCSQYCLLSVRYCSCNKHCKSHVMVSKCSRCALQNHKLLVSSSCMPLKPRMLLQNTLRPCSTEHDTGLSCTACSVEPYSFLTVLYTLKHCTHITIN